MQKKTFYQILQVDPSAEQEIIDAAYKRLALKYHPDINKTTIATSIMQEINSAYAILSNPAKRAEYDQLWHQKKYNIIYKSNFFSSSSPWKELKGSTSFISMRDGYYHLRSATYILCHPGISLNNFKLSFDMQISNIDDYGLSGCFFGADENSKWFTGYRVLFNDIGEFMIDSYIENQHQAIVDWKQPSSINRKPEFNVNDWRTASDYDHNHEWLPINSFVVEVWEGNISLSANDSLISTVYITHYEGGIIGLVVGAHDEEPVEGSAIEARFRNFCLYSIKN
jgi:curved DNA-binding protein CbpA